MVSLNKEERIYIVRLWEVHKSYVKVRRALRLEFPARFHGKNLPNDAMIYRIVQKFTIHGTVVDRRLKNIPHRAARITSEQIKKVTKFYTRRQRISIRVAGRRLFISHNRVFKILRKYLKKRAFKARRVEGLTDSQKQRRVNDVKSLLSIPNLMNFISRVWFTDESWFTVDGIRTKKDKKYWALSQDSVRPLVYQSHPVKILVWAAISSKGLIGPYFFEGNVNQVTYQECLRWFIKELRRRKMFKSSIIMQDGATPHTALSTREFLRKTFRYRVVGKFFAHSWPPYSPDLTPADFVLWPYLKNLVYTTNNPFNSVTSLKRKITLAFRWATRSNDSSCPHGAHLTSEVRRRWELCVQQEGSRV